MSKDLIELQKAIRMVFYSAMMHPENNFEKKEYHILSEILLALEKFPNSNIPFIRFGILIDYVSYLEEIVIRFEEDFLWLGLEGIERTGMGSDSYEKEYMIFDFKEYLKNDFEFRFDTSGMETWIKKSMEFMECSDVKFTIENY